MTRECEGRSRAESAVGRISVSTCAPVRSTKGGAKVAAIVDAGGAEWAGAISRSEGTAYDGRGERIRTSGLLLPKQFQPGSHACSSRRMCRIRRMCRRRCGQSGNCRATVCRGRDTSGAATRSPSGAGRVRRSRLAGPNRTDAREADSSTPDALWQSAERPALADVSRGRRRTEVGSICRDVACGRRPHRKPTTQLKRFACPDRR